MSRIVFLVKNYIGFGHIQRTLLVAQQISALEPGVDIIFISQARSLLLFAGTRYRVINFPFLPRLATNALASTYEVLLHEILALLQPSLVIEDNDPDEWYLSVPALQNVPRLLLLQRIDPLALEDFRRAGYFSLYDRVLVVNEEQEFLAERLVNECDLLLKLTDIFRFVGPVFRPTQEHELAQARKKYGANGKRLVVINAGAGGDHFNDAYCERLFVSMARVAQRFADFDCSVHFIFIVGPYYHGTQPEVLPNVTTVRFEAQLSALLHIADIAVIRPGYNVTYEALAGGASIILVPGISYRETQYAYTRFLQKRYGLLIGSYDDADLLFSLTQKLLADRSQSALPRASAAPCQINAARAIIEELNNFQNESYLEKQCTYLRLFFLIGNVFPAYARNFCSLLQEALPQLSMVVDASPALEDMPNLDYLLQEPAQHCAEQEIFCPYLFLQSSRSFNLTREMLIELGVKVVFYTDKTILGPAMQDALSARQWCEYYSPANYGILAKELYHLQIRPGQPLQLPYRVSKLARQTPFVSIYLDLSLLAEETQIEAFARDLRAWLASTKCQLLSAREAAREICIAELA